MNIMGVSFARFRGESCEITVRHDKTGTFSQTCHGAISVRELCELAVKRAIAAEVGTIMVDANGLGMQLIEQLSQSLPSTVEIIGVPFYSKSLALTFFKPVEPDDSMRRRMPNYQRRED